MANVTQRACKAAAVTNSSLQNSMIFQNFLYIIVQKLKIENVSDGKRNQTSFVLSFQSIFAAKSRLGYFGELGGLCSVRGVIWL